MSCIHGNIKLAENPGKGNSRYSLHAMAVYYRHSGRGAVGGEKGILGQKGGEPAATLHGGGGGGGGGESIHKDRRYYHIDITTSGSGDDNTKWYSLSAT